MSLTKTKRNEKKLTATYVFIFCGGHMDIGNETLGYEKPTDEVVGETVEKGARREDQSNGETRGSRIPPSVP